MSPDVRLIGLQEVFERVCVEEGAIYQSRYRWNHKETDDTVAAMIAAFVDTLQELADYIEAGDVETLTALANQERTHKLLRATMRGAMKPAAIERR